MYIIHVVFLLFLPWVIYINSDVKDLPEAVYDGSVSVREIDFGALKFSSGTDGKEILARLDAWSRNERAKAENELRESLPPGWIISQDAPALCVGLQDVRRVEAEIALLSSISTYNEYQTARQVALDYVTGFETYRVEQEQQRPSAENLSDAEAQLLDMSWQDQTLKRYVYFKIRRSEKIDHIFKYFENLILTERCIDNVKSYNLVKRYISQRGWPSLSSYGNEFSRYLFLLVQHFSFDPDLLYISLKQIKSSVDKGEANPRFYPDLYDKLAIYSGRPQRFATFYGCIDGRFQPLNGVEDVDFVDARRATYGLPPLSEKRERYPDRC